MVRLIYFGSYWWSIWNSKRL